MVVGMPCTLSLISSNFPPLQANGSEEKQMVLLFNSKNPNT